MIKYSELFKAKRQAGSVPTLKKEPRDGPQEAWRQEGRCVECGKAPQLPDSLLCRICNQSLSMDEIRQEIESIRKRILGDPPRK
jgi:hypothetical protein